MRSQASAATIRLSATADQIHPERFTYAVLALIDVGSLHPVMNDDRFISGPKSSASRLILAGESHLAAIVGGQIFSLPLGVIAGPRGDGTLFLAARGRGT